MRTGTTVAQLFPYHFSCVKLHKSPIEISQLALEQNIFCQNHQSTALQPTWEGRGWWIPPFNGNPFWTAIVAFVPALLACILIFMDQQITTVIVNRKENKLKKVRFYLGNIIAYLDQFR